MIGELSRVIRVLERNKIVGQAFAMPFLLNCIGLQLLAPQIDAAVMM
jgi:hypothetical protein